MTAKILDGAKLAKSIRVKLEQETRDWVSKGNRRPGLAVVLVGDDPASEVYVKGKERDCKEVGFYSRIEKIPTTVTQQELEEVVRSFNSDDTIDGLLVQTPLPEHIDEDRIVDLIDPKKDVDGFHPYNMGRLAIRRPALRCCTPWGVMQMLDHIDTKYHGLETTIIGASNNVGRPLTLELLLAGCTVTTTHKFTKNIETKVQNADLVISAVGKPNLVPASWIKPGAIAIDIGITRDSNGKLHGDFQFEEVKEVASWITPVPGGVGPMTRAVLLQNTMQAAIDYVEGV